MTDIAIITEACIDTKDRACVDVCPVQCIYERPNTVARTPSMGGTLMARV